MKKRNVVLIALLAAMMAVFTACQAGEPPKADVRESVVAVTQAPTTRTPVTTTPPKSDDDSLFLAVMEMYDVPGTSSQQIRMASLICESYDAGATTEQIYMTILQNDGSDWGGYVVGAAVTVYCPLYLPQMEAYNASLGVTPTR